MIETVEALIEALKSVPPKSKPCVWDMGQGGLVGIEEVEILDNGTVIVQPTNE